LVIVACFLPGWAKDLSAPFRIAIGLTLPFWQMHFHWWGHSDSHPQVPIVNVYVHDSGACSHGYYCHIRSMESELGVGLFVRSFIFHFHLLHFAVLLVYVK